jgi:hypothetical protein
MFWYRKAAIDDLDEWFAESKEEVERRARRKRMSEERVTEPYVITLYRGMNLPAQLPSTLRLDPSRSEQGMLWFAHSHVRGYDPVEYAMGHGNTLLTYPLGAKRHYLLAKFDDGTEEAEVDRSCAGQAEDTLNTRFLVSFPYCIELPEGWVFTYKHEKFIGCLIPITVSGNMLSRDHDPVP